MLKEAIELYTETSNIVVVAGVTKSFISVPSRFFEKIPQELAALNNPETICLFSADEFLSSFICSIISLIV